MKDFTIWFVMLGIILVLLFVQHFFVGADRDAIRREHKKIDEKVQAFEKTVYSKRDQIPTQGDMESGGEYLDALEKEGKQSTRLWRHYTAGLNDSIQDGQVVYPPDYQGTDARPGQPVEPQLYAAFLLSMYLNSLAETENELAQAMMPAWREMAAESMYALNPGFTPEEAAEMAAQEAPGIAAVVARIYRARDLIPLGQDEPFGTTLRRDDAFHRKRLLEWRKFLIQRDILRRVVVHASAEYDRKFIVLERQNPDEPINLNVMPKTEVGVGKGWYFIERIESIKVEPLRVGNATMADTAREGGTMPQTIAYQDVFRVTIELVAHNTVVDDFMRRILDTTTMYYVPVGARLHRIDDAQSMSGYRLPHGTERIEPAHPTFAYAQREPIALSPESGFERESPVRAVLVYDVFRTRLPDTVNPSE